MSKRTGLAVLVVALAAAIAWLVVWRPGAPGAASEPQAGTGITRPAATDAQLVDARSSPVRTVESAADVEPAPLVAMEQVAAHTTDDTADLEATIPMDVIVVDETNQPIFDAEILVEGMRSASSPGSWFEYRGDSLRERTDTRGRAHLACWTWADIDGRVTAIDIVVRHPEFVPFREDSFRVSPGEHRIVLARGAVVSVAAWHESPSRRVDAITIHLDRDTMLGADAWTRESDGRMVTTRIAPGSHVLRVTHRPTSTEDILLFSEFVAFDVRSNERVDLTVELHGALELRGFLDVSVPRPVVDGHVMLSLHLRPGSARATLAETFETTVSSDGSFVLSDLPPGEGHVFALARGYVSELLPPRTLAEAGITMFAGATPEDEARALAELGRKGTRLQAAVVPAQEPLIVRMVATGKVEVTLHGDDASPIAHALVYVSPNVSVPDVGSSIVPWRDWSARTDALGVARFDDVPPDPNLWVTVTAEGWQFRAADRLDTPSVEVMSGQLALTKIVLERVEAPTPK